jgi:hypothetical protein
LTGSVFGDSQKIIIDLFAEFSGFRKKFLSEAAKKCKHITSINQGTKSESPPEEPGGIK